MKKILKYQLLINKWKQAGIKYLTNMKTFLEYSNDMKDVYPNINYYNPEKKNLRASIVFDDSICNSYRGIHQKQKVTCFPCFHPTIIFAIQKKYQFKGKILFNYENFK